MADRVNPVRVLSGNGAVMNVLSNPPVDWSGSNPPYCLCSHTYLWGAMGDRVDRSSQIDHDGLARKRPGPGRSKP